MSARELNCKRPKSPENSPLLKLCKFRKFARKITQKRPIFSKSPYYAIQTNSEKRRFFHLYKYIVKMQIFLFYYTNIR